MKELESESRLNDPQKLEGFLKSEGVEVSEDETLQAALEGYIEDKDYSHFENISPSVKRQMMHELFITETEDRDEEDFRDVRLDMLDKLKNDGSQVLLLREFVDFLDDTISSFETKTEELEDDIREGEIKDRINKLQEIKETSETMISRLAELGEELSEVEEIKKEFSNRSSTNSRFSSVKSSIESYVEKASEKYKKVNLSKTEANLEEDKERTDSEESEVEVGQSEIDNLKKQINNINRLVSFLNTSQHPDNRVEEWRRFADSKIEEVRNIFEEKIKNISETDSEGKALENYLIYKKKEVIESLMRKRDYQFQKVNIGENDVMNLESYAEEKKEDMYELLEKQYDQEERRFIRIYQKIKQSIEQLKDSRTDIFDSSFSAVDSIINRIIDKFNNSNLPEVSVIELQTRGDLEFKVLEEKESISSTEEVEELIENQQQQLAVLVDHFNGVLNNIKSQSKTYLPEGEEGLFNKKKPFFRVLVEDLDYSHEEILQTGSYKEKYKKGKDLKSKPDSYNLSRQEEALIQFSEEIDKIKKNSKK